eukprot:GHVU01058721.1.p1 GENE.GHVU01058721.1~~GHVU01058721.1.p1  ORF type:complete len:167 (-),score=17.41 GHVU01058721.1:122-622(-)
MAPRLQEWNYFTKRGKVAGTNLFETTCKACDEVAIAQGSEQSDVIIRGRRRDFVVHLKSCKNVKKKLGNASEYQNFIRQLGEEESVGGRSSIESSTSVDLNSSVTVQAAAGVPPQASNAASSNCTRCGHSPFIVDRALAPGERVQFQRKCRREQSAARFLRERIDR